MDRSTLQAAGPVPPVSFDTVRPLIEEATGGPIEICFSRFDEEAVAAASIS
jgi:ubiquinone biosynthesis protein